MDCASVSARANPGGERSVRQDLAAGFVVGFLRVAQGDPSPDTSAFAASGPSRIANAMPAANRPARRGWITRPSLGIALVYTMRPECRIGSVFPVSTMLSSVDIEWNTRRVAAASAPTTLAPCRANLNDRSKQPAAI
jgi:hypothetical protein